MLVVGAVNAKAESDVVVEYKVESDVVVVVVVINSLDRFKRRKGGTSQ
jgi:hypothetical protein